jgi:DNA polymerase III alpha subunit (gram-positive type)
MKTDDGILFNVMSSEVDLWTRFEGAWQAMCDSFVVVDLETTGLHADVDEVLEFAAVLVNPAGEIVSEFNALVRVTNPVPGFLLEETGITKAEIERNGHSLAHAMTAFLDFVGSRPVFIHHAEFDYGFLKAVERNTRLPFNNPVYDTFSIALFTWPDLRTYRAEALASHVGFRCTGERALDAARAISAFLCSARDQACREDRLRHPTFLC